MPDPASRSRSVAALALGILATTAVLATAGPQAAAQTDPWSGSAFDASVTAPHTTHVFDIGGVFVRSDGQSIVNVDVNFDWGTYPSDGTPGCTIPTDADDVNPQPTTSTTAPTTSTPGSRFRFRVAGTKWPCNGNYSANAIATAGGSQPQKELDATIRVAVPPAPVPSIDATVAGGKDAPDPKTGATADDPATVVVTWDPLDDPDGQYPDFVGYRVQRAGPGAASDFATVSEVVIHGTSTRFNDTIEAPGNYRYRVQSLRTGSDGPGTTVGSTAEATPTVSVEVAGPPNATTTTTPTTAPGRNDATTTRRSFGLPQVDRSPPATTRLTVPGPPTTIDTGFDETLDYGDLPEPGDELAGEGQSIIQNEGEGAGLLGPVAGAMVLLGWAGHVAYLNRLAKQF